MTNSSWMMRSLLSGFVLFAMAFSASGVVAQVIVLQSSVPKYKAGKTLTKTDRVTIPEGGSLMVVLPTGATRTINGPFEGKVSGLASGKTSNAALFNAVKEFVRTGGSTTQSVGAMRSVSSRRGGRAPRIENAKFSWTTVPISARGDVCLEKGAEISLIRGKAGKALTVTVVDMQSSNRAKVRFEDADTAVAWPAELQLKNNSFAILPDGRSMQQIRMRLISPVPTSGSKRCRSSTASVVGCNSKPSCGASWSASNNGTEDAGLDSNCGRSRLDRIGCFGFWLGNF